MEARHEKGQRFETLAADWLQAQGVQLLERNFHGRRGEIDLIVLDGDCLCFVEVKYRASQGFGGVRYSIGPAKQQKLLLTAEEYLNRHPRYRAHPQRIDALLLQQNGERLQIDWIHNAIEASGF